MDFFIIENGQQAGPFTIAQLAEKKITSETLVWREGMGNWAPAWTVQELRYILQENQAQNFHTENQQQGAGNQSNSVPPVPPVPPTSQVPPYSSSAPNQSQGQPYQQGQNFQQGQDFQPKKKKSYTWLKVIGAAVVVLLIVMCFNNPSKQDHEDAIRTEVGKAIDKTTSNGGDDFFSQGFRMMARMMAGSMLDSALDQLFEYHNYIIFSKGTVTIDGKSHTVSYGIFGKVITMNADDMVKALEKEDNMKIEESSSSSSSNGNLDGESNNGNNSDEDFNNNGNGNVSPDANADDNSDGSGSLQQRLEDKANQAVDRAVDKASKKLEDKINQKLDQVTDTSTIEKIIDKILELF